MKHFLGKVALKQMVIRRNGPFEDMALEDMVLDKVWCSPYFMPICSIVKTLRCRGRPDALLHEAECSLEILRTTSYAEMLVNLIGRLQRKYC